jgi:hypothetical protein
MPVDEPSKMNPVEVRQVARIDYVGHGSEAEPWLLSWCELRESPYGHRRCNPPDLRRGPARYEEGLKEGLPDQACGVVRPR